MKLFQQKRIYLDYAGATPVDPKVNDSLREGSAFFVNASALYKEGVEAGKRLEQAKNSISKMLMCRSDEIVFTSGGTEGNNLAIMGVFKKVKLENPSFVPHFIFSTIEHSSVLECANHLKEVGGEVTLISPEENGIVQVSKIKEALKENTVLVSLQYVNNEIGTIQKLGEVAKIIRHFKKEKDRDLVHPSFPYFHTDACQANLLPLSLSHLHVDLLTLDAGKVYGPKGVGLLFVRRDVHISPILLGGGQEKGLRSGTEALPQIIAFEKALEISEKRRKKDFKKTKRLQTLFWKLLKKNFGDTVINGSVEEDERVPFVCNFALPGEDSEFLVFCLDSEGIAVSSASSCQNTKENSYSYVVREIHPGLESSSLRVSFGRETTGRHVKRFFKALSMIKSRNNLKWNS